jgi:hypothetical protein
MRISRLTAEKDSKAAGVHGLMCPYSTAKSIFCSASIMTVAIDNRRKAAYCCTEEMTAAHCSSRRYYGGDEKYRVW